MTGRQKQRALTPEYTTALEMALAQLRRRPTAASIVYFDEEIAAGTVDEDSEALACACRAVGVRPGDRVALLLQNVPQFVIALLAIWKLGAIAVPVNPMLKARELIKLFSDCRPRVVICLDELYELEVRPAAAAASVDCVLTTSVVDWLKSDRPAALVDVAPTPCPGAHDLRTLIEAHRGEHLDQAAYSPEDLALLVYTSGTTGPPKGAMCSHRNVVFTSIVFRDWLSLTERDRCLGLAPLFHVTGLICQIGASLAAGCPLLLAHRFEPGETLRLIERQRPTFTVAAITAFIALMGDGLFATSDLSSLLTVYTGGAPVPAAVVDRWHDATGRYVHNAYGMTETTSPALLVPLGSRAPVDPKSGVLSVGIPVDATTVEVVDDRGVTVPIGEVGELRICGPGVVSGYWEKPEETTHALAGGRLRTGDVGFVDENGWFFLVDRRKDMIVASGYKVWPREVEDSLYEHPAVHEAAVVGVPDDYRGETVKAFVVLRPGAETSPEELIAFARERMAAYKYPRQIEIVTELPKTATGKVLRRQLRLASRPPGA